MTSSGFNFPARLYPVSSRTYGDYSATTWRSCASKHTSRIAQVCFGSSSFIFPLGKPHPEDDFQPFTSTHYIKATEIVATREH